MTNRKEMPAPFELERDYTSMNGSGRRCATQQGWRTHVPGTFMAGLSSCDNWFMTKRDAVADAWQHYDNAHTRDPAELLKAKSHSHYYIQWLLRVWPEAPSAKAALALQEQRDLEEKQQVEDAEQRATQMAATVEGVASGSAFSKLVQGLVGDGYTEEEIAEILTAAAQRVQQ